MKSLSAAVYPLLEKCREDGIGVPNSQKPAAAAAGPSTTAPVAATSNKAAAAPSSSAQAGLASAAAKKVSLVLPFFLSSFIPFSQFACFGL